MKYTVLLQKEQDGYSATVPGLPQCRSRGTTEDEALDRIRAEIAAVLDRTKAVEVEVPSTNGPLHPWRPFAGIWKHDPSFDSFLDEIKAERLQEESEKGTA